MLSSTLERMFENIENYQGIKFSQADQNTLDDQGLQHI